MDVGGPQESSDGSAAIMSESDIGAMVALCGVVGLRRAVLYGFEIEFRDCGRTFGGARTSWSSRYEARDHSFIR